MRFVEWPDASGRAAIALSEMTVQSEAIYAGEQASALRLWGKKRGPGTSKLTLRLFVFFYCYIYELKTPIVHLYFICDIYIYNTAYIHSTRPNTRHVY